MSTDPRWVVRDGALDLSAPRVMGILNLTPDSFSDGGRDALLASAIERAESLRDQGAALLDVGGESTRPGAPQVSVHEQLARVIPFLREAAPSLGIPISIDTRSAAVASAAIEAGASIVNDVSGLAFDPDMGRVVAESGAGLVLMHMRGTPETMNRLAVYDDVVREVRDDLTRSFDTAERAGIDADRVVLDPGLGFAKGTAHNLALLGRLPELVALGRPVLVGPSRKRFLGELLGTELDDRVEGTIAACLHAYAGGALIFRVHDVGPVRRALDVAHAIHGSSG